MQNSWAATPLARLFSLPHEYALLRQFALVGCIRVLPTPHEILSAHRLACLLWQVGRIRVLLHLRGLYTLDAFRAFNASQNGLLTCSELYGGLSWLGLQVHQHSLA